MLLVTEWERSPVATCLADCDGIRDIRIKTVAQIPSIVENRDKRTVLITMEHTGTRKLKNGRETNFIKEIWTKEEGMLYKPMPKVKPCPHCNGSGRV